MTTRATRLIAALAVLFSTLPAASDAQVRRGRQTDEASRWAPIAVGVKFGWDSRANGELVSGQLRIPVLRNGTVELVPNAEVVFLNGAREHQYNADVAVVPGGVRGGLLVGAGIGWRNSLIGTPLGAPRQTFVGLNLFGGGKSTLGPFQIEFALRWTFLSGTEYQPNSASVGLNFPLWRVVAPR